MIDTHCHLAFPQLAGRVEEVLADAAGAGVHGMITVSTTSADCRESLALAERFENVWCTAGIHPLYADQACDWETVRTVARHPRCVAWGELGLDNHYQEPLAATQRRILEEHLALIESCSGDAMDKPLIIHCRDAFDDLLPVLGDASFEANRCVFHCFNSTSEDARKVLDFGAWISFTGIVTFRNARQVAEAAKLVPPDRIMVETDSPFLTPEPMRKIFPNEPQYLVHIARFLADLRGADQDEFAEVLDANARSFFGISAPQRC
ncbi:MAG: TatD family hydrolase [Phycisphaerales bacterium]|nr:MAG: TatD family hydrolase [Phycisphaerales bacterium]